MSGEVWGSEESAVRSRCEASVIGGWDWEPDPGGGDSVIVCGVPEPSVDGGGGCGQPLPLR